MDQYENINSIIEASKATLENHNKNFNEYVAHDERLSKHKDFLERSGIASTFNKLVKANAGVRKIHNINYNGTIFPMRLLTLQEIDNIHWQTLKEMKEYPEYMGGEDHPFFIRRELIKQLSKITTPSPEINEPFLTEQEAWNLPEVAFFYLKDQYDKLNLEYNLAYNPNVHEDITKIIALILDGVPLTEKKLALLSGLSFSTVLSITIRLFEALIRLEDNAQYITLLENLINKTNNETQSKT